MQVAGARASGTSSALRALGEFPAYRPPHGDLRFVMLLQKVGLLPDPWLGQSRGRPTPVVHPLCRRPMSIAADPPIARWPTG